MSEKKRIVEALKQRMKAQGVTYAQMAAHIGVSEATMKRYLSLGRFTLDTLDSMCEALSASLEELFESLGAGADDSRSFYSFDQEKALARDELLFAIFYLVAGGWRFSSIAEKFEIRENVLVRSLVQLDKLGLIDYRSNDNIRLVRPVDTQWIPSGPLWMKYQRQAIAEFFGSDFSGDSEHLNVNAGTISPETAAVIRRKFLKTEKEIQKLISLEDIPAKDRSPSHRYWFITAMRPMSFSALSKKAVEVAVKSLLASRRS